MEQALHILSYSSDQNEVNEASVFMNDAISSNNPEIANILLDFCFHQDKKIAHSSLFFLYKFVAICFRCYRDSDCLRENPAIVEKVKNSLIRLLMSVPPESLEIVSTLINHFLTIPFRDAYGEWPQLFEISSQLLQQRNELISLILYQHIYDSLPNEFINQINCNSTLLTLALTSLQTPSQGPPTPLQISIHDAAISFLEQHFVTLFTEIFDSSNQEGFQFFLTSIREIFQLEMTAFRSDKESSTFFEDFVSQFFTEFGDEIHQDIIQELRQNVLEFCFHIFSSQEIPLSRKICLFSIFEKLLENQGSDLEDEQLSNIINISLNLALENTITRGLDSLINTDEQEQETNDIPYFFVIDFFHIYSENYPSLQRLFFLQQRLLEMKQAAGTDNELPALLCILFIYNILFDNEYYIHSLSNSMDLPESQEFFAFVIQACQNGISSEYPLALGLAVENFKYLATSFNFSIFMVENQI